MTQLLAVRHRLAFAGIVLVLGNCVAASDSPSFDAPLAVSANGRYLIDAAGTPFYYVADTPWQLLASLNLADTKEYIDIRASQGFTALQLVATPWSFDDRAANWDFEGERGQARVNAAGEVPFFAANGEAPKTLVDVDFRHPNEAYWQHVDAVLSYLRQRRLAAYFIPLWASNFAAHFSAEAHYAIGSTLGRRYRRQNNLLWVLGGDEAQVSVAKYRQLYQGLRDAGITQLVTMHPRAGRSSSLHLDEELDFHSIQDRGSVTNMLQRLQGDYRRTPVKPTFLCETWYEHDRDGGVFRIHKTGPSAAFRAHYWAARLHGGFGEGYGAWTIWLNLRHWREDIHRPGAAAIATHMKNILTNLDWHNLVPDDGRVLAHGDPGAHAARSDVSRTAVVYFERPTTATLNLEWFGGEARLVWYDAATGAVAAEQEILDRPTAESIALRPPPSGDSVLVARSIGSGRRP